MDKRQLIGQAGEDLAATYLEGRGWSVLERNWRFRRLGEIDIIAVEPSAQGGILVFCEVKTRSGTVFGEPLEAITQEKLRRLRRLASAWMATHPTGYEQVRIDAIGVLMPSGGPVTIVHTRAVG